jgi:hypothetical protein
MTGTLTLWQFDHLSCGFATLTVSAVETEETHMWAFKTDQAY